MNCIKILTGRMMDTITSASYMRKAFVAGFLFVFAGFALSASIVSAAPVNDYDNWNNGNVLPTETSQYINIAEAGGSGNYADTSGTYSYESSEAWVKIYTKRPTMKGISIQFTDRGIGAQRACTGYNLVAEEYKITETALGSSISSSGDSQSWSISPEGGAIPCNIYKPLKVNSGSFTASGAPEHQGLYVAVVRFKIDGSDCGRPGAGADACKTPSFRLQMDPGIAEADAKLAIAGESDVYFADNGSVTGNSRFNRPVDPNSDLFANGISIYPSRLQQTHSFRYSFKPPCVLSGGSSFSVKLIGLDSDGSVQTKYRIPNTNTVIDSGNTLRVKLTRADGSRPAQSENMNSNGGYIAVDDDKFNTTYVLEVTGITGGNGIRLVLPFDSGSGKFSCPAPPNDVGIVEHSCTHARVAPGVLDKEASRYQIVAADRPITRSEAGNYPRSPYWAGVANGALPPNTMLGASGPQYWEFNGMMPNGKNRYKSGVPVYFYYIGYKDKDGRTIDAGTWSGPVVKTLPQAEVDKCFPPPQPKNWRLLTYAMGPSYVELGSSAKFSHVLGNSGPDIASGYFGGMESNYDINNPGAGTGDWRYNGYLVEPAPTGNNPAYDGTTEIGSDINWLGRNYCQRYFADPRAMVNDVFAEGRAEASVCAIVVGGKTGLGSSKSEPEIEPNESATFQIDLGTNHFTAGGGWTGYEATCVYELFLNGNRYDRSYGCTRQIGSNGVQSTTINVTGASVGDLICMNASLSIGNAAFYASADNFEQQCIRVVARPYFKVFAGDISAGNGFCGTSTTNASVIGWNTNDGATAYRGSGVQYAIYAQGIIKGVAPGRYVPDNTNFGGGDPKKLAFANTGIPLNAGEFGGSFQAGSCITDYFSGKPDTVSPWFSIGDSNNSSYGVERVFEANASTILRGVSENSTNYFQLGNNTKLYVNGDVYINSDITAQLGAESVDLIPNFMLIAKGNIYIDKNVRNLFGTYVAQPNGNSKGEIYTCSSENAGNFTPVSTAQAYNECRTQLKVTGAFVARKINLQRTLGSLYMDRDGNAVSGSGQANAAEIFQYNPLTWLRQSTSSTTTSNDVYDAMNISRPTL